MKRNVSTTVACLAGLAGFVVAVVVNYSPAKADGPKQELQLHVGGTCVHVHHWLVCAIAVGALWLHRWSHGATVALSAAIVGYGAEGFLFPDWYDFRCPVRVSARAPSRAEADASQSPEADCTACHYSSPRRA